MGRQRAEAWITEPGTWADLSLISETKAPDAPDSMDYWGAIPFFAVHVVALVGLFFVPFHLRYLLLCTGMYVALMFGITGGYHRYFSHRSYKTSRFFQFVLALLGTLSVQKGVLWWAANHRHHHRFSDQPEDLHSPVQRGFWWSHVGWIISTKHGQTKLDQIRDLAKYPELRFLNKYYLLPPVALATTLFLLGGWPALYWGFFLSTVLLWHGTLTVNSLAHVWGKRRYATNDDSRNNLWIALITLGEGWHNNHHHYMSSTRQGFYWWEVDFTYYVLKALSWLGVVWDLRAPPESALGQVLPMPPQKN